MQAEGAVQETDGSYRQFACHAVTTSWAWITRDSPPPAAAQFQANRRTLEPNYLHTSCRWEAATICPRPCTPQAVAHLQPMPYVWLISHLCYRTKFGHSRSNRSSIMEICQKILTPHAFQGHSRSLESTRIDRPPKTSY